MKKFDVLISGLRKETSKRKISFHSPGHKGKIDMMNEDFFEMDFTADFSNGVVTGNAFSYLTMSQNHAANLYRTQRSFYLAGGVESGIYTMLTLCLKEGDKIIVGRNCQKAVIDAIILLGIIPIFVTGTYMPKYGIFAGLEVKDIEEAVKLYPDAKAVFLTTPSYYGMVSDVKEISIFAHEHNMYVLADESGGGHFSFSQRLPASASRLGADFVVQSLGKNLESLCGTGILHVNSNDFVSSDIYNTLGMYQTSEPSYAIYAICERTVQNAFMRGRRYKTVLDTIKKCAAFVNENTKAYWIDQDIKNTVFDVDFTKVVINFADTSLKGYDVARILDEKYSIEIEMCDECNIVCTVTLYNKLSHLKRLANAIVDITRDLTSDLESEDLITRNPAHNLKITPRDAFFAEGESIDISEAAGRISKNAVTAYKGISPILVPGEEICDEHIKAITDSKSNNIIGIKDGTIIEVVKNS